MRKIPPQVLFVKFMNIIYKPGRTVRIKSGANRGLLWKIPPNLDNEIVAQDRDKLELHQMHLGNYELEVQAVLKRLIKPGDVCYDIGANVGFFTLLMAHLAGPTGFVEAFEPVEKNREVINEEILVNKLSNIRVHEEAVSSKKETVRFVLHKNRSIGQIAESGPIFDELKKNLKVLGALFYPERKEEWYKNSFLLASNWDIDKVISDIEESKSKMADAYKENRERIDGILLFLKRNKRRYTFDTVYKQGICIDDELNGRLRIPDFVKIDVEGAEGLVLEGMKNTLKNHYPTLYIELHGEKAARSVRKTLDEIGGYAVRSMNLKEIDNFEREPRIVCIPNKARQH